MGSIALATILAGSLAAYGCGDDEPNTPGTPDAPTSTSTPDAPTAVAGTYTHYVTKTLKTQPASSYGHDYSGDGMPDNRVGTIIGLVAGLAQIDVDATLDSALGNGTVVLLHSVKATSLTTSASATWQVYLGAQQSDPDLDSGNGEFDISNSSPTTAVVSGAIAGGTFDGGPAEVTLSLALIDGQPPIVLTLHDARITGAITAAGCTGGQISGGIKRTDVDGTILPLVAKFINDSVEADGTCKTDYSTCNATNSAILGILDQANAGNKDGVVTVPEILGFPLLSGALAPDIDVLKADGTAGTDGMNESLSIGLGFTCTKAVFTASTEH